MKYNCHKYTVKFSNIAHIQCNSTDRNTFTKYFSFLLVYTFTIFWRQILYFVIHYIHLTTLQIKYIVGLQPGVVDAQGGHGLISRGHQMVEEKHMTRKTYFCLGNYFSHYIVPTCDMNWLRMTCILLSVLTKVRMCVHLRFPQSVYSIFTCFLMIRLPSCSFVALWDRPTENFHWWIIKLI